MDSMTTTSKRLDAESRPTTRPMGTDHRPWPVPSRPWVMSMQWRDLLFAHWPVSPATVRDLLPTDLEVDTFDGNAWVGVVPFWMSRVRARCCPPLPSFPELNLRTYARCGDRAGVWFFSLDAHNRLAVGAARTLFKLPYYRARMQCSSGGDEWLYDSQRVHPGAPPATFSARYRSMGPVFSADPGSLAEFLTERYLLYTIDSRGRLKQGDIDHAPWPLQPAEIEITANTLPQAAGLALPDTAPLCFYAARLDVRAWMIRRTRLES